MIKVRKLMSLVMVFALVVSMTTIGASASEEATESLITHEDESCIDTLAVQDSENEAQEEPADNTSDEEFFECSTEDLDLFAESQVEAVAEIGLLVAEDAVVLDAVETVEKPTIDYGQKENTIAISAEITEYYSMAFEALELINDERAAYGLEPVVMDEALLEAAMHRAAEITQCWTHQRPNGTTFSTICSMIRNTGENIGYGCVTAEQMIDGWMSSTGHKANIIYDDDVAIGVGCVKIDGYIFWVMDCSTKLYKEAYASDYSDKSVVRTVHGTKNGVENVVTVYAESNNITPGSTVAICAEYWNAGVTVANVVYDLLATDLIYSSSDESVCAVSSDGTITGVGEGTATITAYYPGYEEGSWEIQITVCEHEYSSEMTTAPTCNAYGEETFTCSKCGDMYTQRVNLSDHAYDDGVVTTEMSCMSSGVMTYTCGVCGHKKTETIEAPYAHSYDSGVITVAPTCVSKGTRTYTCTVCGATKTSSISYGSAYHCYDEGVVTSESTCTSTGILTSTCIYCEKTKTTRIAKTEHNYDEGVVTKEVSCTEDGVTTYTCGSCGAIKTEPIESTGEHSYSEVTWSSATCEAGGVEKRACACGATTMVTVPALGHDIEEHAGKAATCTEGGYNSYETCARCDYTTYEAVSALGHSWDDGTVTTAAGCETSGIRTYICANDPSHTRTETIEATGHAYDGGKTTKNATCTETGIETYTCTGCGNTYTEVLPAREHLAVSDAAVTPTCEGTGLTEGSHCSRCEIVLVAQETLPAAGHTWDEGVVTKAATAEETGIMTYTCTVCKQTKDEDIAYTEGKAFLRGDVDENGVVDIIDCVRLVRYNAGYDVKINYDAADMTGDGSINTFDIVRLIKYIAGYDV